MLHISQFCIYTKLCLTTGTVKLAFTGEKYSGTCLAAGFRWRLKRLSGEDTY